ncbi:3-hydroxy-9,10-secoandrosta-1,3,5(10)-triene-9,17-dione monooxygenase oxygenase subunit [Nocardia sp. NPDC052254]|uniref:3-hydroxy-9,10-secoandrosta-1,3,5(10)-triene-9, 17-dione monooxygenase oxygenase subunit n=1 Tax=Nocardia sp. NPDC052254 TaxID=3155681 RepID=UPI0034278728
MSDDVLRSVHDLLPVFAERAQQVDESGHVCDATIEELGSAGVLSLLQPGRYGGREGDPLEFYRAVRAIAGVCGSTGWLAAVLGVHPWHLALFDQRAQDEVWGADPAVLVSSAYAPMGRLRPVAGGYELTGSWKFSSGCDHASWALLGAVLFGAEGRPVDFFTVLVPRQDYSIHDVWDVVGMRGTASNEISVPGAFVPEHRVVRNYETAQLRGPGQKVNAGPLYRLPFATIFTYAVATPIVGIVEGCYESYLSEMHERVRLSLGGGRFAEDSFAQVAVARAASEVDAATLQLERNLRELWDLARAGADLPMSMRLRSRRDQVRATERSLTAIDLLFKTAGGNSLHRGNPVARAWRDAHAGSAHVANEPERALALFGRGAFGLPVEDNLI